mmetsp:Transcript_29654/g.94365  ORF Transcript_29654/g.94365 Transcript_29654/m.94365 type:complete len:92 (-) Transcript_29654:97-372(-)
MQEVDMPLEIHDEYFEDELAIASYTGGRHGTNALPATSILALAAAWATGKLNTVADATGEAITYALNHLGAATRLVVVVPSIAIIFLILAW